MSSRCKELEGDNERLIQDVLQVKRLSLKPSDIVVIKTPMTLSKQGEVNTIQLMKDVLQKNGYMNDVIVSANGTDIEVIEQKAQIG